MATGFTVGGVDFDLIFKARVSTKRADVGFTVAGTDISNRYEKATSSAEWIPSNTGFTAGGTDLRELFMDIDYVVGPTITNQPDDVTVVEGDELAFTVAATGVGTITYQWQKKIAGVWTDISGETSTTLSIDPCARTDQGDYRVLVTDDNGTTTSDEATGTVNYPPAITDDPDSGSLNRGDGASFSVSATAGQPAGITYQWYRNGTAINGSTDTPGKFSGWNTNNLTFSCDERDHNKQFKCRVSNSAGFDDSANATLLVHYLDITDQPDDTTINQGSALAFSVTAVGYTSLTYQWHKWNGSSWISLGSGNGGQTANYSKANAQPSDSGDYMCAVGWTKADTSTDHTDTASAEAVVHENPYIVDHPDNTSANGGDPAGFTCEAGGDGTLQFEWFKGAGSVAGPRNGNVNATTDSHIINPISESDEGSYHCRVTNSHGGTPANSNNATLTVNHTAISIVVHPVGFTGADGTGPYALAVNASGGDGDLYFQWFFDDGGGPVALHAPRLGNIDGTHDQHVLNPVTYADAGDYFCRITDEFGAGPTDSNVATVTVI